MLFPLTMRVFGGRIFILSSVNIFHEWLSSTFKLWAEFRQGNIDERSSGRKELLPAQQVWSTGFRARFYLHNECILGILVVWLLFKKWNSVHANWLLFASHFVCRAHCSTYFYSCYLRSKYSQESLTKWEHLMTLKWLRIRQKKPENRPIILGVREYVSWIISKSVCVISPLFPNLRFPLLKELWDYSSFE